MDDLEVHGGGKGFVEQAAGFVSGAGVVLGEVAGQGRFGVVGRHADRVVGPFVFAVEAAALRDELAAELDARQRPGCAEGGEQNEPAASS